MNAGRRDTLVERTRGRADALEGTGYRTIRRLGAGGMGEVVEAEHIALKKTVVVKVLLAELAKEAQVVDRMRLQAQALARLSSPHIVSVSHFAVTADGRPFIVMERLVGRTLHEELKERRVLPWREAVAWTAQMLEGLDVAHKAGLVHRDVKLANLFLCDADKKGGQRILKVLDFGVAKVVEALEGDAPAPLMIPTEEGVLVGTPRFVSPEQMLARPVDARSDIYAAALVLYALVAGRGPFDEAKNFAELARAHVDQLPPPLASVAPQSVPPELERAIRRALAKSPGDRFASASQFAAALHRCLENTDFEADSKTDGVEGDSEIFARAPTIPLDDEGAQASQSSAPEVESASRFSVGLVVASAVFFAAVAATVVLWLSH